jgi:hypothetical protein
MEIIYKFKPFFFSLYFMDKPNQNTLLWGSNFVDSFDDDRGVPYDQNSY